MAIYQPRFFPSWAGGGQAPGIWRPPMAYNAAEQLTMIPQWPTPQAALPAGARTYIPSGEPIAMSPRLTMTAENGFNLRPYGNSDFFTWSRQSPIAQAMGTSEVGVGMPSVPVAQVSAPYTPPPGPSGVGPHLRAAATVAEPAAVEPLTAAELGSKLDFLAKAPMSGEAGAARSLLARYFPTTLNTITAPWAGAEGAKGIFGATKGLAGRLALRGLAAQGIGQGIDYANRGLLGDTAADPTNLAQTFTRGVSGGTKLGGFGGWVPGVIGALGAGIGNTLGSPLSNLINQGDGESGAHLGNVPIIGSFFGGGSGATARDLTSKYGTDLGQLTEGNIEKRLDAFGLTPEQRKAVTSSFNSEQAQLRGQGMSNEEATAQMFQRYFTRANGNDSLIKQFKEGKAELPMAAPSDTGTSDTDVMKKALAYQAMLAQVAPNLLQPQHTDMSFYNEMMNRAVSDLDPSMRGWAESAAGALNAQAGIRDAETTNYIASLPMMLAQQEIAKAQAENANLQQKIMIARMAGGNQDIVEPG